MASEEIGLDDVLHSPYTQQLVAGFRMLRFSPALESEYRQYLLEESVDLKRVALFLGIILWTSFTVLDIALAAPGNLWATLLLRMAVLSPLLLSVWLVHTRTRLPLLQVMSHVCILSLGIGGIMIIGNAHQSQPNFPYEGLFLVCMAAYFLVGFRLIEALVCSTIIMLVYLFVELWVQLPTHQLINNFVFMANANLIGAVGCYLLEFKSREHFLTKRVLSLQAEQDSLTGLDNRRSLGRIFTRLWRQARRESYPISMLLCDLDFFKQYNDSYGHQAGDEVLVRVASILNELARRPLDVAVRFGGEEFVLIYYNLTEAEAVQRAELLCHTLRRVNIEHGTSAATSRVSVSIGVAMIQPHLNEHFSDLYKRADDALYKAKEQGRNRVVCSCPC
ncbi:MAG: GGDEF domain-containing protein [Pseudomonas marincola]|uniref:GGDEF domain-containing protein n=1 Tax=Pseudomonas marincola TaxID=437900 RepID=UPI00300134D7